MATQPPVIDPVPTPPIQRGDRATFSSRVDAFILWLVSAVSQFGAVATNVYNNALEAVQAAISATSAAATAVSASNSASLTAGATPWVSGTNYAKNAVVISQINFQAYRRTVAGSGTTDPANDTQNVWAPLYGDGTFTPRVATTENFDLSSGNYFTRTMSSNDNWVFSTPPSNGFSFCVELNMISGTLVLPASVKTPNNLPYSMSPNRTHLLFFVTSNGGENWRMSAAINYVS